MAILIEAALLALLYALRGQVEIPTVCVVLAWTAPVVTVTRALWRAGRAFQEAKDGADTGKE